MRESHWPQIPFHLLSSSGLTGTLLWLWWSSPAAHPYDPHPTPPDRAWDLINEPACRDCPPGTIAGWVREMAAYVKGLDSKHLLTVGEEGFYSTTK